MTNRDEEAIAPSFTFDALTDEGVMVAVPITYGHTIPCDCTEAIDLSPFGLGFFFLCGGLGIAAIAWGISKIIKAEEKP